MARYVKNEKVMKSQSKLIGVALKKGLNEMKMLKTTPSLKELLDRHTDRLYKTLKLKFSSSCFSLPGTIFHLYK